MSPAFGGWGGRYVWRQFYGETRPTWTQGGDSFPGRDSSRDLVVGTDGKTYWSDQATVWRWRTAFQNDFAARMDWTIKEAREANHNPEVVVNGRAGKEPLTIDARVAAPRGAARRRRDSLRARGRAARAHPARHRPGRHDGKGDRGPERRRHRPCDPGGRGRRRAAADVLSTGHLRHPARGSADALRVSERRFQLSCGTQARRPSSRTTSTLVSTTAA